jgi:putative ABC transport system permease protein
MKPGITAQGAQAGIDGIIKTVEREYPANAAKRETIVEGLVRVDVFYRNLLLLLFGSVALILLMAVINVGNLMLSRSLSRGREIAIRSALGAGKRRLARQLLTESLLLAVPGGFLGIAVASAGVNLIVMGLPNSFPRVHEIYLDATVMLFALATTFIASIAFGVFPAFAFERIDLQQSLKSGAPTASQSRRSLRLRQALVAAEIGLAAILLVGAALMGKSFWNLLDEPLGMDTENVSVARLLMRPRPEAVRTAFYDELIQRIGRYPGVDSAGFASHTPLTASFFRPPFTIEGRTALDNTSAVVMGVTPDYFRTLRIGFVGGRSLTANEQFTAVINEKLAREFWPNSDPIGSRIKPAPQNSPWLTIVGVVRDEKLAPGSEVFAVIYRACGLCGSLIVKASDTSTDIAALIRREVAAVDSTTLITGIQTIDDIAAQAETVISSRFQMALFLAFAGAGLLLALAGVYGVTSYSSAQRTREVGIRLALGATRFNVLSMMMRQSMLPIVLGITAGVAVASALTGFLQSYLFGVTPLDPSVFAAVPVFLALVAIIANFIPLCRGTRIDPVIALRHE